MGFKHRNAFISVRNLSSLYSPKSYAASRTVYPRSIMTSKAFLTGRRGSPWQAIVRNSGLSKRSLRGKREAKNTYREKAEAKMGPNSVTKVWKGMQWMTGCGKTASGVQGDLEFATKLSSDSVSRPPPITSALIHSSAGNFEVWGLLR